MSKLIKKIRTRLLAGALAVTVLAGTIPAGQIVSAAQPQTIETVTEVVGEITGFAELPENAAVIRVGGKVSVELLTARMPSSLEVYLKGYDKPVTIPVTWKCVGDYENTHYYSYEFDPVWDESRYTLSREAEKNIPYIGVFLSRAYGNGNLKMAPTTENEKTIYQFLKKDLRLNTAAACGVLANIQCESSFNPTASVLDTNNKTSYGICQWNGVRFDALKSYCSQNGYDYKTLEGQLNYLKYELEHSEASAFSKVKNVENTADGAYTAGYNWARYFERCASAYFEWRAKLARDTYWPKYSGDSDGDGTETEYSITYYLYEGTNNAANPDSYKETSKTITLKDPVKTGYTFQGWYKDSSMTNKITSIPKGSKGDLKLYAKWKANKYTIRFMGNKAGSGSISDMSCEYDSTYKLSANKFKRTGYKFTGWNTKANGKGTSYANKEEIENLSEKDGAVITLYAQWKKQVYEIDYRLNGGRLSDEARETYAVDTKTFKLENPTRTGYTFEGWYKEKKFKTKVTQITKGITGNITLYAKWSVNQYKIQYKGNGATSGSMSNVKTCKYGTKYTLAANKFKRTDYVFTGWNTKADGSGKSYANKAQVKNLTSQKNKTITLYAQWEKKSYSIKYELNGGIMLEENPTVYYADAKTFKLKSPEREGYTFAGWYTEASFKNKITQIKKGTRKNYKLYAKWKVNTYTVQFDGNGATGGTMTSLGCEYGKAYTLPANGFVREGYQFIGWSLAPDGSNTFYGDLAQVQNLSTTKGAVVTLYAQWEKLE